MSPGTKELKRGGALVQGPWKATRVKKASRPKEVTTEYVDDLFSHWVRERAGWVCARCGVNFYCRKGALETSHFFNVRYSGTRYDFDNCIALCHECHQGGVNRIGYEHQKKTAYLEFMKARLGELAFEALRLRSQAHVKLSEAKLEFLAWHNKHRQRATRSAKTT